MEAMGVVECGVGRRSPQRGDGGVGMVGVGDS